MRVAVKFYGVPCWTIAELRLELWCWLNSLSMWSNERGPEDCWRVQGRILCWEWAASPSSTSLKWSSYVHFANGLLEGISRKDPVVVGFFLNNHLNSAPFLQWAKLQFGRFSESWEIRETRVYWVHILHWHWSLSSCCFSVKCFWNLILIV